MIKTVLQIGESSTCPLNKFAYVWLTQSTIYTKCENGCVFAKTKPQSIIATALH